MQSSKKSQGSAPIVSITLQEDHSSWKAMGRRTSLFGWLIFLGVLAQSSFVEAKSGSRIPGSSLWGVQRSPSLAPTGSPRSSKGHKKSKRTKKRKSVTFEEPIPSGTKHEQSSSKSLKRRKAKKSPLSEGRVEAVVPYSTPQRKRSKRATRAQFPKSSAESATRPVSRPQPHSVSTDSKKSSKKGKKSGRTSHIQAQINDRAPVPSHSRTKKGKKKRRSLSHVEEQQPVLEHAQSIGTSKHRKKSRKRHHGGAGSTVRDSATPPEKVSPPEHKTIKRRRKVSKKVAIPVAIDHQQTETPTISDEPETPKADEEDPATIITGGFGNTEKDNVEDLPVDPTEVKRTEHLVVDTPAVENSVEESASTGPCETVEEDAKENLEKTSAGAQVEASNESDPVSALENHRFEATSALERAVPVEPEVAEKILNDDGVETIDTMSSSRDAEDLPEDQIFVNEQIETKSDALNAVDPEKRSVEDFMPPPDSNSPSQGGEAETIIGAESVDGSKVTSPEGSEEDGDQDKELDVRGDINEIEKANEDEILDEQVTVHSVDEDEDEDMGDDDEDDGGEDAHVAVKDDGDVAPQEGNGETDEQGEVEETKTADDADEDPYLEPDVVNFVGQMLDEDVEEVRKWTDTETASSSDTSDLASKLNDTRGGSQVPVASSVAEGDNLSSVGSMGLPTSTLNRQALEELEDKPTDAMVSVVTWNLAEESPEESDATFFRQFRKNGIEAEKGSDLVLVSGQECENIKPRRSEGRRSREYRRLMIKMLGNQYVPIALHLLGGIQFGLFAKKSFLKQIQDVKVADVTCGIGNVFHNKGAIAAFLTLKARNGDDSNKSKTLRMMLVTAHMAAHVKNFEARDADFWRISSELEAQAPEGFLPMRLSDDQDDGRSFLFDSVDRVFFCGDLNYRVDLPREITEHEILTGSPQTSWLDLMKHDQLSHTMSEGRAFPGFAEGKLEFAPTFKYDKETGDYDTSHKHRIPAWTDRILFKPSHGIRALKYTSVSESQHSDHRPVFGTYRVSMEGRELPPKKQRKSSRRKRPRNDD